MVDHAVAEVVKILMGSDGGDAMTVAAVTPLRLRRVKTVVPVVSHLQILAVANRCLAGPRLRDCDITQRVIFLRPREGALHSKVFKHAWISESIKMVLTIDRACGGLGAFKTLKVLLKLVLELWVAFDRPSRV